MTEAELLRALDKATANIMRLAGKLRWIRATGTTPAPAKTNRIKQQRALAHELIARLLTMPSSTVQSLNSTAIEPFTRASTSARCHVSGKSNETG